MLWGINNFLSPWECKVPFSHIAQESEQSKELQKDALFQGEKQSPGGLKESGAQRSLD